MNLCYTICKDGSKNQKRFINDNTNKKKLTKKKTVGFFLVSWELSWSVKDPPEAAKHVSGVKSKLSRKKISFAVIYFVSLLELYYI